LGISGTLAIVNLAERSFSAALEFLVTRSEFVVTCFTIAALDRHLQDPPSKEK
jgi:hypothetical protein